ncbi:eukaryotic translation initiation factor 4E type 2 isoform X2 [Plodia interpunctella]|uniref:eukaryotic translation initiation factor 4E type 2 isoform X2 n=1 Tax=Plodia interpunctella TaxID=58824 RepID=UPI002368BDD7|nr:eukaryotic translation initiation factor 4E type 2 isoform X2 [Plodia interpunctella]
MTERKMCKFYNLNVPDRRSGEGGQGGQVQNHGNNEDEERISDENAPPPVPPHEHKLEYSYWMWFSRRPPARELSASTTGYGQALRLVGRVASVEQWWGLYTHLARPADLPPLSDLHLFKLGIKPMWEDPANVNGGKWVVRLRKAQTGRAWEDLCMAMLGEQFMVGPELCGVVLSVRFQEDHLAVWHRTAADTAAAARVRDALRRILQLPAAANIEYKAHGDCLRASAPQPDAEPNCRPDARRSTQHPTA